MLSPFDDLTNDLIWQHSDTTATYSLRYDTRTGKRDIAIDDLGEPWNSSSIEEWVLPAITTCTVVHVGALSNSDFTTRALASLSRRKYLSLDAQALVRPGNLGTVKMQAPTSLDLLEHVTILKLSLEEAAVLDIHPKTASMRTLGIPEVVLTAGTDGAFIYTNGRTVKVTSEIIKSDETTGAGDAFIACYLNARIRGTDSSDSGNIAAKCVTEMLRRRIEKA